MDYIPESPVPIHIYFHGFGFFVEVHLLESLKLELRDLLELHGLYFKVSHSRSFFGNVDCIKYYPVC